MQNIILLAGIILLTSCSEKTQTVEWYKQHPEVLRKEFEKCKLKTLAELATDKHCTVIRLAEKEVFDEQQINAPLPDIKF
ncbi:MAG: hypothetical protein EOP33_00835 [Rickettsiaceae bacterium]|nr:MAG: hypothetical protein EOP33_00835 [Rickettsiaceae bacterium]